jgi:hypothetical protein
MKPFKHFFEDDDTVYDVAAKPAAPEQGDWAPVGQADDDALDKIKRRTHKYETDADAVVERFLDKIGFLDKNYTNSLTDVLDAFDVDYIKFATFLQKSKSKSSYLKSFRGKGEDDFFEKIKSRIVTQLDISEEEAYPFYHELCKINHPQGRVGVGECEFMLAVLTEGVKGITGDIGTLKANGREYEVGTQSKVISNDISREIYKTVPTSQSRIEAGNLWNDDYPDMKWTQENMNEWITTSNDSFVNFDGLEQMAEEIFMEERLTGVNEEKRKQVFCCCVLHKYLSNHKDDVIVLFNGGAKRFGKKKGVERDVHRSRAEFLHCRWMAVGTKANVPLITLFKECVKSLPWFGFTISGKDRVVRITYR